MCQCFVAQDFFSKDCWAHHPKPYADFMDWRLEEDKLIASERSKLIPSV